MKAPRAPDPYATAQAQAQMNAQTANTTQRLNMVNQYTPYGNLDYFQDGNWSDGTAKYGVRQTLTPAQQGLLDQEQQFDRKFNEIGLQQTDKIGNILSQPLNLNNEATEARLMELGRKRLDPMFQEREQAFEQNMADRGIRLGSAAYDSARRNFDQGRNDAYNQLLLSGRGQAVQEALTERSAPINEISALMSGGQVQSPQFVNTPNTQVANTDLAGLVMDNYRAKQQNYQAGMGGLFGLGSSLLTGGGYLLGGGRFGR